MPETSLSEAALWAGKGRPAILKAIQKGTLSARKDNAGQWRIDPSELARVYRPGTIVDDSSSGSRSSQDIAEAIAGKDRELGLMRELLEAARREAADARGERDKATAALADATATVRLLTHNPPGSAPVVAAAPSVEAPAAAPEPVTLETARGPGLRGLLKRLLRRKWLGKP